MKFNNQLARCLFQGVTLASTLACATVLVAGETKERNGDLLIGELAPEEVLFTGKPFDGDLDAYLFRFRNYNPETCRWESQDPMGFPDGANSHAYAPVPTSGLDWQGCFALVNPAPSPAQAYDAGSGRTVVAESAGKEADRETVLSVVQAAFPTWTFQMMNEPLAGTLTITKYKAQTTERDGENKPAIDFAFSYAGFSGSMTSQLKWIQIGKKTGQIDPFLDIKGGDTKPFYPGAGGFGLSDIPTLGDGTWTAGNDFWASTFAAVWDGQTTVKIYDGIYWGGYVE